MRKPSTSRAAPLMMACAAITFSCAKPEPDRHPGDASPVADAQAPLPGSEAKPRTATLEIQVPEYVKAALASPRIVVLGDSIVHYSDELVSRRLASAINSSRDGGAPASATGVTKGGQLINGWIGSQVDRRVAAADNNIIVLQGGVNDIGWWGKLTDSPVREESFLKLLSRLDGMVSAAILNGKVLVLVSVSPWKGAQYWSGEGQKYTVRLNSWMHDEASRPGVFFADTYSVLESRCESGMLEKGYRGVDVQHTNDAGRMVIGEVIARSLGFSVPSITPPATPSPCRR